jgi:hypothetical protein
MESNQLLCESDVEIDYQRYGDGEARLSWLDETIHLSLSEAQGKEVIEKLISKILQVVERNNAPIGHLKFLVKGDGQEIKVSISAIRDDRWKEQVPPLTGKRFAILMNARVEMASDRLKDEIQEGLRELVRDSAGLEILVTQTDCFHPRFPNPTHRRP